MNNRFVRPSSGQHGGAILELAIVLPLLVILLFGFIELGRALYQENLLVKSVTTGARFISRAPEAVTASCQLGTQWPQAAAGATRLVVYTSGGTGEPRLPGLDDAGAVTFTTRRETTGGLTVCVIHAEAKARFMALFGDSVVPLLDLGPIVLNAQAEERYIGD